jgi:hypothetical protein
MHPPIVVRQQLGKHVPAATNTKTIKGLLGTFSLRTLSYQRKVHVCVSLIIVRERLCKHVPAATNTKTTKEGLLGTFSVRSVSHQKKVGSKFFLELPVLRFSFL